MPPGTLMAYCLRHGIAGSLSGGCIEENLLEKLNAGTLIDKDGNKSFPQQVIFGASTEEQQRLMLPCGGQVSILVECLLPQAPIIEHFTELSRRLSKRQPVGRRISITDGQLSVETKDIERGIRQLEDCIEHGMGLAYQMLLIGASEVARSVAELARPLDFKVSVWDHREEFIRNWQVENVEVFKGSPQKLISQNFSDENNAIIALAHDPRVDDIALVDALESNAFYIGAIGSTKTCNNRRQRLLNYVDDVNSLDKMHAPVGMSIGSKTPYEIAISILAEVIKERRQLEKSRQY